MSSPSKERVAALSIDVEPVSSAPAARLAWYWNRLRCMSPAEIACRIFQRAHAQVQQWGWNTAQSVPAPAVPVVSPEPLLATRTDLPPDRYVAAAARFAAGRASIFGREYTWENQPQWNRDPKTGRRAPMVFGKTLDYRDPARVGDIKYLWELNRHLMLLPLAQAYRMTGEPRHLHELKRLLDSWFEQCVYLQGPNWTSSLELGIRLINWSLIWELIGADASPLFRDAEGAAFRRRWLEAVYRHLHFIRGHFSRFSSANNHLIGELAGLYIGASTWPCWKDARRWRTLARRRLVREALRQNAADGVNREQAVSYQQFVLDFLLIAGLAGRRRGDEFPAPFWRRIERMLEFIAAIMGVRGHVPMIGDADDGYVATLSQEPAFCPYRSLLATGAVLYGRADFKAKAGRFDDKSRWLLGAEGAAAFDRLEVSGTPALPRAFPEGGYYVLGRALDTPDEIRVVVDCGPLGYRRIAAHGHADALAFCLSLGGCEFLVDPGTYAYHTGRPWRDYFRGTAAHNTVRVDREDQSLAGGNFLWRRHARAECVSWEPGTDLDRFVGMHDGYERLPDPVRHIRTLALEKHSGRLCVTDRIECHGRHHVERSWHFAENVAVGLDEEGAITAVAEGWRLRLLPLGATPVRAALYRGAEQPKAGWISRRFDHKTPTATVIWESEAAGVTELQALLECERLRMESA